MAAKKKTAKRAARATKAHTVEWPSRLWHGTSAKGLERLRAARSTKGLYVTSDENTACDYAESSARHDGSAPVLVEIDVQALRRAGGEIVYDEDHGEVIFEQLFYRGPVPKNLVFKVSKVQPI